MVSSKPAKVMSLILIGAAVIGASFCTNAQGDSRAHPAADSGSASGSTAVAAAGTRPALTPEQIKFYRELASSAWPYMDANYRKSTGLVSATPNWANTTVWDIGGQLLAFHAAKELGLLSPADYDTRTTRLLATLQKVPLFRGTAFNRVYSTIDGSVGEGGGHGYAATDLGRLLIALKVVSVNEPKFAPRIARIVKRIDFTKVVKDGYLQGQLIGTNGKPVAFQEGRIGYEQYAARGFSAWGADVANALDVKKNGTPVTVLGVPLLADARWQDRLLSEPFILYGLELGMPPDVQELATNVLRAQQARYDSTGTMTIATEDASSVGPDYFYYYCVYCNRKPFVIDVATSSKDLDAPRWVSTKAAFGWQALMPSPYTQKAVDFVAPAKDAKRGWASGVDERSGASTNAWDVNTASVLLEVADFQLRGGKPLIEKASIPAP